MRNCEEINKLTAERIYNKYNSIIDKIESCLIQRGNRKAVFGQAIVSDVKNVLYEVKSEEEKEVEGLRVDIDELMFYFEYKGFGVEEKMFFSKCLELKKCSCDNQCERQQDLYIYSWNL